MNTKARTIETFDLGVPYAPEMVELEPADASFHGGISIEDATASSGFLVLSLAYLGQSANDRITLYLNDENVADTTVAIGKEADDIPLLIPAGLFQKGENRIKFGVKRTSSNESFSKELILLHRNSPPGDNPAVLDIKISHASIGPGEAEKVSVTVSYKNMQWYDRIVVDCNGVQVRHQLLPDSTSPLPAVPKSVQIPISKSVLEQSGDDSDFEFKYRVTDYLSNASQWSRIVTVDVHLDRFELPMATLREIATDDSDDPSVVDLEKMKGGPLWVLVHLVDTVWRSGDTIRLAFTAELDGKVVAFHEEKLALNKVPNQLAREIPNAKVVADSNVSLIYQLIRGEEVIATSTPALAQVIGASAIKLPPPILRSPAVNPIDVIAHPHGIKLRIKYPEAQSGDRARLVEVGAPAGTPQFPLKSFDNQNVVDFGLEPAFLAARMDKELKFRWNLNRGGHQVAKSALLELKVQTVADADIRLPEPLILEQKGEELALIDFEGDATFRLARWTFIGLGQMVSATLTSKNISSLPILTNYKVTDMDLLNGLEKPVSREWLARLSDGVPITLESEISTTHDNAIKLKENTAVIRDIKLSSGIEQWDSLPIYYQFQLNIPTPLNSGIIIELLSTLSNLYVGNYEYRSLYYKNNTKAKFSWRSVTKQIKISTFATHSPNHRITFYDRLDSIIETLNIPTSIVNVTTLDYKAPTGRLISYFIIESLQETPDPNRDSGFLITSIEWLS